MAAPGHGERMAECLAIDAGQHQERRCGALVLGPLGFVIQTVYLAGDLTDDHSRLCQVARRLLEQGADPNAARKIDQQLVTSYDQGGVTMGIPTPYSVFEWVLVIAAVLYRQSARVIALLHDFHTHGGCVRKHQWDMWPPGVKEYVTTALPNLHVTEHAQLTGA